MARKSAVLIPAFAAAVLIGGLGIAFMPQDVKEKSADFPKGTVRVNDDVITVEIAETAAEKQRWMTFRQDRLSLDTAMLIRYQTPDLYEIWMFNVQYNLDLIWFDQEGNAVYIKKDVSPCEHILDQVGCTYKPTSRALYVMAGTAGFADEHGIDIGSKMTLVSV
jgi:uncharacterized protein